MPTVVKQAGKPPRPKQQQYTPREAGVPNFQPITEQIGNTKPITGLDVATDLRTLPMIGHSSPTEIMLYYFILLLERLSGDIFVSSRLVKRKQTFVSSYFSHQELCLVSSTSRLRHEKKGRWRNIFVNDDDNENNTVYRLDRMSS